MHLSSLLASFSGHILHLIFGQCHIVCDIYIYILIYPIIPMVVHGVHSLCWLKYNDFQAFASPNQRMLHPMFDITILLAI